MGIWGTEHKPQNMSWDGPNAQKPALTKSLEAPRTGEDAEEREDAREGASEDKEVEEALRGERTVTPKEGAFKYKSLEQWARQESANKKDKVAAEEKGAEAEAVVAQFTQLNVEPRTAAERPEELAARQEEPEQPEELEESDDEEDPPRRRRARTPVTFYGVPLEELDPKRYATGASRRLQHPRGRVTVPDCSQRRTGSRSDPEEEGRLKRQPAEDDAHRSIEAQENEHEHECLLEAENPRARTVREAAEYGAFQDATLMDGMSHEDRAEHVRAST